MWLSTQLLEQLPDENQPSRSGVVRMVAAEQCGLPRSATSAEERQQGRLNKAVKIMILAITGPHVLICSSCKFCSSGFDKMGLSVDIS